MLAQSLLEYGGLAGLAQQLREFGRDIWFRLSHPREAELLVIGGCVLGLLVVLRLWRAK